MLYSAVNEYNGFLIIIGSNYFNRFNIDFVGIKPLKVSVRK